MSNAPFNETLTRITTEVVAKHAEDVDKSARFPSESIEALQRTGLLGLISDPSVGGMGKGLAEASLVVRTLAQSCASTAMVTCMHYSAAGVIEKLGPEGVRKDIANNKHLSTLAFSEAGSRSQFWAPTSRADAADGGVRLTAKKSWVTSAHHADSYVWSSLPTKKEGMSSLWLVPRMTEGVRIEGRFDGLGLRGNDSTPITAEGAFLSESQRLGEDGAGFDVMMSAVLPAFNVLNASCSVGLMQGALERTKAHLSKTEFTHDSTRLCDLPTIRAYVARMQISVDTAGLLLDDTIGAIKNGRPDAMLRVLECKAAAGEAATSMLDLAMRVTGGAAFRKEVAVERSFRDARAATIMGPTTDVLYDFIGKAVLGLDLF